MIAVEFQGQPAWLCNHPHNWAASATLRLAALVQDDRGQTGREGRTPLDDTLRARLNVTARLPHAALIAFRNATQTAQTEPVLLPVWPLALSGEEWANGAHVESTLVIGWQENWSAYTISAGPLATPAAWDYVAPLLQGYLSTTETGAINDEAIDGRLEFEEDDLAGSFPLLPDAAPDLPSAPVLGAFAPSAFPFEVDWALPVKSGHATIRIQRSDLGGGRRKLTIAHPQSPERPIEGGITLQSAAQIAQLITWWRERHGSADAHWVSTWISGGRLAADAGVGAEELQLEPGANISANRFLALHTVTGVEIVEIEEVDGNTLILSAPLTAAAPRHGTRLSLAILGRHAQEELTLNFTSPYTATAKIAWHELAAEYAVPLGEERGVTLGRKRPEAYLFTWTEHYAGTIVAHRRTSWRAPLTVGDDEWTPWPTEIGERRVSLIDPQETSLQVETEWWPDCPFKHFMPGRLSALVYLTVAKVKVVDGAVVESREYWHGRVKSAPRKGAQVRVTVGGPDEIFLRRFPVDTMGPNCNADLYDARCGILRADWKFTANIVAVGDTSVDIEDIARVAGLPPGFGFAHWFARGIVEWTIGDITKSVAIYDSTVFAAGAATLHLRHVLDLSPGPIDLYPSCDLRRVTCDAWHETENPEGKFGNRANFRGFARVPDRPPQFTPPKKSTTASGKK